MADEPAPLLVDSHGPITILTLNRPDRLNALSSEMQQRLIAELQRIERDHDVRVVILTGAGRGFCAGGDVKIMGETRLSGAGPSLRPLSQLWGELPLALRKLSRPVIAAVNGPAAGAGFDIALSCDIRLGSTNARFAASFVRIGLVPDNGGMYLLPRTVGTQRACELIFSGRLIDARQAQEYGVLLDVVEPDALMDAAVDLAQSFARNAPLAVGLAKRGIYRAEEIGFEQSFESVNFGQTYLQQTLDHREGVSAFLEKRDPEFVGR